MKSSLLILFICLFLHQAACAQTLGGIDDDSGYTVLEETDGKDGFLDLLVYHSTVHANGTEIISSPVYKVMVNDMIVAEISQGFLATAMQSGEFNYLSLSLPNGKYSIELHSSSVFGSELRHRFNIVIRKDKKLTVVVANGAAKQMRGLPAYFSGFTLVPKARLNENSRLAVREAMQQQATIFFAEEATANNRRKVKEEAQQAAWQEERERAQRELDREFEERARIAKLREQRQAEEKVTPIVSTKVNGEAAQESKEKDDDEACQSFGAKVATPPYIACRVSLINARREREARDQTVRDLEKKIEILRSEIQLREARLGIASGRDEDPLQREYLELRRRLDDGRRRQDDRNERLSQAQRAFEAAAALSQSTQIIQPINNSPFQQYIINGKTWNCNSIGGVTQCR